MVYHFSHLLCIFFEKNKTERLFYKTFLYVAFWNFKNILVNFRFFFLKIHSKNKMIGINFRIQSDFNRVKNVGLILINIFLQWPNIISNDLLIWSKLFNSWLFLYGTNYCSIKFASLIRSWFDFDLVWWLSPI